MLKNISNINGSKKLSKKEQKSIKGGFLFPVSDCCACVFVPAGQQFPIFITQSCETPCPTNGSLEYQDTGC